jgi:putative holliday junction resolvase
MRLLGVDYGFKRIGLATCDSGSGLFTPIQPLAAAGSLKRDAAAIAQIAKKESAEEIVVGLPLEPEGGEGRMARICRTVGGLLEEAGYPVHFVDESLTSNAAEGDMIAAGLKAAHRKRLLDSEAAARILERFLR